MRRARGGITRDQVCKEALALVDAEGLEALTMRRLGARLGVEAMSLYRHVEDKADLLDALHAAVLGGLKPRRPAGTSWRPLLAAMARALRATLLAHPAVIPLLTSQPVRAPEALATLARVEAAFRRAGFARAATEKAIHVVGMFAIGHVLFEKRRRRDDTFALGLEALLDGIENRHRRRRR